MKKILILQIFTVFFVLFGCTDKQETIDYKNAKSELARIYAKRIDHQSLANETVIDSFVKLFEEKGTEDDVLMAKYCRGYYYFDNNDREHAYQIFVDLYAQCEHSNSEVSKEILRGTFSICVLLCLNDRFPTKAEEWLQLAEQSGVYASHKYSLDYLKATLAIYRHQEDSCKYFLDCSFQDVLKRRVWADNLTWCLYEQAKMLAAMGQTADFKKRFDELRKHPYRREDATTELAMGLFYAQNGMRDSALFFYRNAIQSEETDVALEASLQLAIDARNHGENDSVFKYFQDCVTLYDKLIDERQNSYSRRMESMCRTQELKDKVAEQRLRLMTLLFCVMLALLLALGGWMMTIALKRRLKASAEHIGNMQKERAALEAKLQCSMQEVERLEKQQTALDNTEIQIRFDTLCLELKQYAANKQAAPHQFCDELLRLFAEAHHGVIPLLQQTYTDIKPLDILICVLAQSGFGLTEIARITNHDRQEIRQFMQRISKGLTGKSVGRITEFRDVVDKFIEEHATVLAES